MSEFYNQEAETMNEMEMENETLDTNVPGDVDAGQVPAEDWKLADGSPCSKSAFIREQFTKFNKSRKEISEEYNIPYRTVYGATVNMENEAEPTTRGRSVTFSRVQVNENNEYVVVKDGVLFINGVEQPEGTPTPEVIDVDRNQWIKEQLEAGLSRGDIAKILDLSYGVVYSITKEAEGSRQKYEVELADGTKVSRSEYIRRKVAEGVPKGEIAKELGVEYSVVWQATKKMKTTEERFFDAVKALEKFIDVVENAELLTNTITVLESMKIKAEEAEIASETESEE